MTLYTDKLSHQLSVTKQWVTHKLLPVCMLFKTEKYKPVIIILTDHLYPMMKHFFPYGSGFIPSSPWAH